MSFELILNRLWAFAEIEGPFRLLEHLIVFITVISWLRSFFNLEKRGKSGYFSYLIKFILRKALKIRALEAKVEAKLDQDASKGVSDAIKDKTVRCEYDKLPATGMDGQQILAILEKRKGADIDPTKGKTFAYVYDHSKAHSDLTAKCFMKYVHSNALNPIMFNSLRVIQNEIIRMSVNLLHGDNNCVGNVTSCGTESLLLAMKTYRDYRGNGQIIMCSSGHPGINKGCYYVGLSIKEIPYDEQSKKMSLTHLRKAISSNTVVVVCSAPNYPFGVVDDVIQIGKICKSYGVPLHVDAAIGGFVLPFIEMEGKDRCKPWDFRVEGVTSINADIHKYGYSPKGSSVLIYCNSKIRRSQYFSFATWPGGIYISPTALGTRNGGCLSAAWGSLLGLGLNGFRKTASQILELRDRLVGYIKSEPLLQLMAQPQSTIVSFRCTKFSCYKLADAVEKRGIFLEKQSNPESIHTTLMPSHKETIEEVINAIREGLKEIQGDPNLYESKSKAVYGMMADIPDEAIVERFVVHYMDKIYNTQ